MPLTWAKTNKVQDQNGRVRKSLKPYAIRHFAISPFLHHINSAWECLRWNQSQQAIYISRTWLKSKHAVGSRHQEQGGNRPGGETGGPLLVLCAMRRRTGTSAPFALPVRLMAAKNFLSTNRKSTFLSLFLSNQWRVYKGLFDSIDPKCITFMSVVMMLK